ncbi:transcriptional regulator [bacterium]|nr:MAG: transcriptional regulator [bacterium]
MLDPLIHERTRLGILSLLLLHGELEFTELREKLQVTDGNLAGHLRKLEDAGYVRVKKEFKGRRPCTTYRLTPQGKRALRDYLKEMRKILEEVEKGFEK